MIYCYLPKELIPELDEVTIEEFLEVYAMAECARELEIEDITIGVNKGISSSISEE